MFLFINYIAFQISLTWPLGTLVVFRFHPISIQTQTWIDKNMLHDITMIFFVNKMVGQNVTLYLH